MQYSQNLVAEFWEHCLMSLRRIIYVKHLYVAYLNRSTMAIATDALTSLVLDASCSTDPDLSPQQYGPAEQGLTYTFECYRHCESVPIHNVSNPMYPFINWTDPSTHYNTSCVEKTTSNTGCFVPFNFHMSGPVPSYRLNDWYNPTYPLSFNPTINNINKVVLDLILKF